MSERQEPYNPTPETLGERLQYFINEHDKTESKIERFKFSPAPGFVRLYFYKSFTPKHPKA